MTLRPPCPLILTMGLLAAATVGPPARAADAPTSNLTRRVADLALRDVRGVEHSAAEWKGRRAVVLFFLGIECPVSNGYAPEMARIADQYGRRGVAVYGVHPDPDVTPEAAAQHAAEYGLAFPILLDPAQAVALQAGVKVTPEAVMLTADGRVLYRGRIDDRYTPRGRRRDEPTSRDLRAALDAVLAGKSPPAAAEAFGCLLPRPVAPPRSTPDQGPRP